MDVYITTEAGVPSEELVEEVRADLEGMQTLRLVGDNMAWLLRSMTAAREAGVVPYEREVRVKTNFYKPEADPNVQGEG